MTKPEFLVVSSLHEDEEKSYKTCYIVMDYCKDPATFADYLEKNTLLSVEGYEKRFEFFFTFGRFFECVVFEVRIKEDNENSGYRIELEQIAIAETYSYLSQKAIVPSENSKQ